MSEYRDELAMLAEEHGIPDEQRAMFARDIACGWLEAKDAYITHLLSGLGLAGRGAPVSLTTGAPSEPQHVAPLRGREGHSHAERGAR